MKRQGQSYDTVGVFKLLRKKICFSSILTRYNGTFSPKYAQSHQNPKKFFSIIQQNNISSPKEFSAYSLHKQEWYSSFTFRQCYTLFQSSVINKRPSGLGKFRSWTDWILLYKSRFGITRLFFPFKTCVTRLDALKTFTVSHTIFAFKPDDNLFP